MPLPSRRPPGLNTNVLEKGATISSRRSPSRSAREGDENQPVSPVAMFCAKRGFATGSACEAGADAAATTKAAPAASTTAAASGERYMAVATPG